MRVAFLGTPEAAVPTLRALVEAGHDVDIVITRPDRRRGRGGHLSASPVKVAAESLGLRVAHRLSDLEGLSLERGIVVAYGALIPGPVLERLPMLNVHFSLLPRWRGAAPVERAILAGDTVTGVTIHETVAALDAGPIAAQEAFAIADADDAGAVYERSAEVALRLLERVLAAPQFEPQPSEGVTYAEKISAADRWLDPGEPRDAWLRVRALSPHIGARARLDGVEMIVWRARLEQGVFVPEEVQPEGRRRMSYAEFLRGRRA